MVVFFFYSPPLTRGNRTLLARDHPAGSARAHSAGGCIGQTGRRSDDLDGADPAPNRNDLRLDRSHSRQDRSPGRRRRVRTAPIPRQNLNSRLNPPSSRGATTRSSYARGCSSRRFPIFMRFAAAARAIASASAEIRRKSTDGERRLYPQAYACVTLASVPLKRRSQREVQPQKRLVKSVALQIGYTIYLVNSVQRK